MKRIIIIILILTSLSCDEKEKSSKEMNIAFEYFDKKLNTAEKINFKNFKEELPIPRNFDYGISADIRNELLQNHKNSEILIKFFDSLGIQQYDDMAGILLSSYQKHLNGQVINLNEQIKSSKDYWKPILDCKEQQRIRRLEIYYGRDIKDTINIKMPIGEYNNVMDYECPNLDWDFNAFTDLSVDAVITDKYIGRDSTEMILKVKILTKNKSRTQILGKKANVGDEFEIFLSETAWKIQTTGNNV